LAYHKKKNGICTIASYNEKYPESKGIIVFDNNDNILKFIEKPKPGQIVSHDANAGIYVCNRKIFTYLNRIKKLPIDFGKDLFPMLLNTQENMYIYHMKELLLDIGTIETYKQAQLIAKNYKFKLLNK